MYGNNLILQLRTKKPTSLKTRFKNKIAIEKIHFICAVVFDINEDHFSSRIHEFVHFSSWVLPLTFIHHLLPTLIIDSCHFNLIPHELHSKKKPRLKLISGEFGLLQCLKISVAIVQDMSLLYEKDLTINFILFVC